MLSEVNNTTKYFPTSYNEYTVSALWITVIGLMASLFLPKKEMGFDEIIVFNVIMIAITALLIWMLVDTGYDITSRNLHYRSGPFRGKIDIMKIRRLDYSDSFVKSSILKPALGRKGLTVIYNKFDDIYISPKDRERFIDEILKINPHVDVKR